MSEVSLARVLAAEKEAQVAVRQAQEKADRIREEASAKAEMIEGESAERISRMKSERLEASEREIAEARQGVLDVARDRTESWRMAFEASRDELTEEICRVLRGRG